MLKRIFQLMLVAFLLYVSCSKIDFSVFIQHCNARFLMALAMVQIPLMCSILVAGLRFKFFLRSSNIKLSTTFNAMVLTQGYTYLLPGRISEMVRVAYVVRHGSIRFAEGLSSVLVERTLDVLLLLFLIAAVLILQWGQSITLFVCLAVGIMVIPVGWLAVKKIVSRWLEHQRSKQEKFSANVVSLLEALYLRIKLSFLVPGFIMGCLSFAFAAIATMSFISMVSEVPLSALQLASIFCTITTCAAIPLLPGGLGTMEVSSVVIMQHYGIEFNEALALTLGIRMCTIILSLPWTLLLTFRYGLGISDWIQEGYKMAKMSLSALNFRRKINPTAG